MRGVAETPVVRPVLKWAGGKGRLLGELLGHLPALGEEVDARPDKGEHQDGEQDVPEVTRHRLFQNQ